jgi:hypothetical protein
VAWVFVKKTGGDDAGGVVGGRKEV